MNWLSVSHVEKAKVANTLYRDIAVATKRCCNPFSKKVKPQQLTDLTSNLTSPTLDCEVHRVPSCLVNCIIALFNKFLVYSSY